MSGSDPGGQLDVAYPAPVAMGETADASRARRAVVLLERIGLGVATIVLSMNLWTGFPLLALWIGSQATGGRLLNMTGVAVTLLALAALSVLGLTTLSRISARYDRVTNRPPPSRQPPPWLLSMSATRVQPERGRRKISGIEMIVITTVVAAFVLFEVWFFFLASTHL